MRDTGDMAQKHAPVAYQFHRRAVTGMDRTWIGFLKVVVNQQRSASAQPCQDTACAEPLMAGGR